MTHTTKILFDSRVGKLKRGGTKTDELNQNGLVHLGHMRAYKVKLFCVTNELKDLHAVVYGALVLELKACSMK